MYGDERAAKVRFDWQMRRSQSPTRRRTGDNDELPLIVCHLARHAPSLLEDLIEAATAHQANLLKPERGWLERFWPPDDGSAAGKVDATDLAVMQDWLRTTLAPFIVGQSPSDWTMRKAREVIDDLSH